MEKKGGGGAKKEGKKRKKKKASSARLKTFIQHKELHDFFSDKSKKDQKNCNDAV